MTSSAGSGPSVTTICEWPGALYNDKTRKWDYGTLSIIAESLTFIFDGPKPANKEMQFCDIVEVKKATTGMVFGAIVVIMKDSKKLWFSSLPDREAVFEAIQHFWRSLLVGKDDGSAKAGRKSGTATTQMGQKLLGIVQDSQDTLSSAAVQLHSQGRQFDNMLGTMADLHNDLDISENLVKDVDSWFGRWRMPKRYIQVDPVFINKSDVPDVFESECLLTKLETGKANTRRVGTIRVTKDGITLLNSKMKTEHHYRWADISIIRVITPWEICITRFNLGKPDLTYNVVSANMVAVIKVLDSCVKYKLRYETPPEKILVAMHKKSTEPERPETLPSGTRKCGASQQLPETNRAVAFNGDVDQIQISQSEQIVSDKEADEISRALSGLKSLALAVQEEESIQNEKLDELNSTVDRANERLSTATRKVKRLT